MKRIIKDSIFGMATLSPKRSGLSVVIWSEHNGISVARPHGEPRVKIGLKVPTDGVSISIEAAPKILAENSNLKKSDMSAIQEGIDYVGRNFDLFLKHYQDTDFDFGDEELVDALRSREEYR